MSIHMAIHGRWKIYGPFVAIEREKERTVCVPLRALYAKENLHNNKLFSFKVCHVFFRVTICLLETGGDAMNNTVVTLSAWIARR